MGKSEALAPVKLDNMIKGKAKSNTRVFLRANKPLDGKCIRFNRPLKDHTDAAPVFSGACAQRDSRYVGAIVVRTWSLNTICAAVRGKRCPKSTCAAPEQTAVSCAAASFRGSRPQFEGLDAGMLKSHLPEHRAGIGVNCQGYTSMFSQPHFTACGDPRKLLLKIEQGYALLRKRPPTFMLRRADVIESLVTVMAKSRPVPEILVVDDAHGHRNAAAGLRPLRSPGRIGVVHHRAIP